MQIDFGQLARVAWLKNEIYMLQLYFQDRKNTQKITEPLYMQKISDLLWLFKHNASEIRGMMLGKPDLNFWAHQRDRLIDITQSPEWVDESLNYVVKHSEEFVRSIESRS